MTPSLKKRFWKTVSVDAVDGGFSIGLDGHSIRTPQKSLLVAPNMEIAKLIASEWRAQDGPVDPDTMPATRAMNSAIDKVAPNRLEIAKMLATYGDTDLVLYRASHPAELVDMQDHVWNPFVTWAECQFNVQLIRTTGVMPVSQSKETALRYFEYLNGFEPAQLTAVHDLITLSGSFILGAAVAENHQPVNTVWQASRLDESYQAEKWGYDEEAEKAWGVKSKAFQFAATFLELSSKA